MVARSQEGVDTAMTTELVRLALRAIAAAAPDWIPWLSATSFVVVVGILSIFYERCRRRTYVAVLEVIQPGIFLLDRNHRHRSMEVVLLPRSPSMKLGHSNDSKS
jgi:hypothetical protein